MNKTELEKRLKWLEGCRFMLSMKDVWSGADYSRDAELTREIWDIKKQLEAAS